MLETALLVGGAFGIRHAFEPDHVAAVSTLVDGDRRSVSTGAAWGIGHSIPVIALGGLFLLLDVEIPAAVGAGFEVLVAGILVLLGVRAIAGREAAGVALLRRLRSDVDGRHGSEDVHGSDDGHGSEDGHGEDHWHLTVAGRQVGIAHSHADEESFAVGVIHGLAGSGGVVVALVAASSTVSGGAGFLAGFSVATVCSMALASWGWGFVVERTNALRVVAGVTSVAVGLLLVLETTGVAGAL